MTITKPLLMDINFQDFMSDKGCGSLSNFFDILSNCGVSVALSEEDFFTDCEGGEDALLILGQLGCDLEFYGKWFAAKVTAFESLCDLGFQAIKAKADICDMISFQPFNDHGVFAGEWCRWNGIVFASYNDVIEVAAASQYTTQRRRNKADLGAAKYLLTGIQNSSRKVTEAA